MNWRAFLSELSPHIELAPPATSGAFEACEASLGVSLPEDLRALLAESNGVTGEHGLDLIWSVERIASQNSVFRGNPDFKELYKPFDGLLFFADSGTGDQYAFRVLAGAVRDADVYIWDHEDDSRSWLANDMEQYLTLEASAEETD